MKRRTLLKGGALIGLAKIGDAMIPAPTNPCVRYVASCAPNRVPDKSTLTRLSTFVEQQQALGRRVVHTHEDCDDLSYAVIEIECSTRQEALLLAQRISINTDQYGPIVEVAYYEGIE